MKREATLFKANGTEQKATPANGDQFSRKELERMVDGDIAILRIDNITRMIINLDGVGTDGELQINEKASVIARKSRIMKHIIGDVVICYSNQISRPEK